MVKFKIKMKYSKMIYLIKKGKDLVKFVSCFTISI